MKNTAKKLMSLFLVMVILLSVGIPFFSAGAETVKYKYGDVDIDDGITARDAGYIQQYLAHLNDFDDLQLKLADVTASGDVDVADITYIQWYLGKIVTAFPSGEYYEVEVEDPDWRLSTISYEIFVRSFYDSDNNGIGDFRGIAEKVDYLKSLNVGCVWLMPIYTTGSYHGYDVKDYTSVNNQYGTIDDFDYMLDTLHDNGIKVIIDFVPNHTSVMHPWFTSAISSESSPYRDYYFISSSKGSSGSWHYRNGLYYRGDFSSSMPDLNYNNSAVWDEMKNAAGFWLDRGVDGFRLDAVLHLDDDKSVNHAFLQDFETYVKGKNSDAFLVGEVWDSTSTVKPYYKDIDSCFDFTYANKIVAFAQGTGSDLAAVIQENDRLYKVAANASPIKDSLTTINSIFITNHDQTRIASQVDSTDKAKLAAAVLMTSKGMPFIYYGEELGQKSNDNDSNRREPFDWYKSASGTGMCNSRRWNVTSQFTIANDGISLEEEVNDEDSIYNYYRKLTKIRNDNKIFFDGTYTTVSTKKFYKYTVTDEDLDYSMFVAHNRSTVATNLTATKDFTDLLTGTTYSVGDSVVIQPCESLIVRYEGNDTAYDPVG